MNINCPKDVNYIIITFCLITSAMKNYVKDANKSTRKSNKSPWKSSV